jgi:hypothetical protein
MQNFCGRHAFLAAFLVLIAGCFKDDDRSSNTPPNIRGAAVTEVTLGRTYQFTPTVNDPDGDHLTFSIINKPAWALFDQRLGTLRGTPTAADLGVHEGIIIVVSDGQTTTQLPPFFIEVNANSHGSATLSWQPPTEREDGSPLGDLAGYRVLYGTSADDLSESDTLDNAGLTRHTISNLSAATWYFAVVSYTASGLESQFSSIVSTTIE